MVLIWLLNIFKTLLFAVTVCRQILQQLPIKRKIQFPDVEEKCRAVSAASGCSSYGGGLFDSECCSSSYLSRWGIFISSWRDWSDSFSVKPVMIISLWAPDTLENGTESSAVLDCVYNFTEQVLVVGWLAQCFVCWFGDWMVVWSVGCSIDWLVSFEVCWSVGCWVNWWLLDLIVY